MLERIISSLRPSDLTNPLFINKVVWRNSSTGQEIKETQLVIPLSESGVEHLEDSIRESTSLVKRLMLEREWQRMNDDLKRAEDGEERIVQILEQSSREMMRSWGPMGL